MSIVTMNTLSAFSLHIMRDQESTNTTQMMDPEDDNQDDVFTDASIISEGAEETDIPDYAGNNGVSGDVNTTEALGSGGVDLQSGEGENFSEDTTGDVDDTSIDTGDLTGTGDTDLGDNGDDF
jgi:hypothetical protein